MAFKKWVKNIQTAGYNGARTVDGVLDHLAIGLVANEYKKLGKTSETLFLSQGLFYRKIPLCYLGRVLRKKIQTIAKRTISSTVLQVVRFE